MYYVEFEGTPRKDAKLNSHAGGAIICCWMDHPTFEDAITAARLHILSQGWIVDDPDEAYELDPNDRSHESGREYYEQALVDKEVFVFHCYPVVDEVE